MHNSNNNNNNNNTITTKTKTYQSKLLLQAVKTTASALRYVIKRPFYPCNQQTGTAIHMATRHDRPVYEQTPPAP
jgi:hypothetical protein